MTEELEHDHIKEIAENYVNESWGSYLDLDEVDLVMAGIGVGKIIASEQEKRIAELEKENAELKQENKVLAQNLEDTEILNKTYEKKHNDLKKENAKLKKQLEMSNKVYNDNLDYSHHIEEQLTNAKELLKQWLQTSKNNSCDNINIVADTEQFLSEVEK